MMNPLTNPYPYSNPFLARPTGNSINWVQGIEGAKAFTLTPRENVILMDSEVNDVFYIKICDDIGRCTLRKFKYQEEVDEPVKPLPDMSEYITRSELEAILNERSKSNEHTVPTAKQPSGNPTHQSSGYDKQATSKQS